MTTATLYRFDDCELDLHRFELRRGGDVVHVEPQVLDVLAHLIANRNRLVPKGELLDAVWGDRFVSESALTSRLKEARRAVVDDGQPQQVIATVHGRGYRFIAQVTEHVDGGAVLGAAVALDQELARHRRTHQTLDGFVRPMQRRVAREGEAAWMIATGDDLRMPTTSGAKANRATRMQHRYLDRVMAAATTDEVVLGAMMQALFLTAPPTVLFRPNIVARAILRGKRANGDAGAKSSPSPWPEHAVVH